MSTSLDRLDRDARHEHDLLSVEGIGRVSPVLLASWAGRSRHCCDAANSHGKAQELCQKHLRDTWPWLCSFLLALSALRHGDFPRSMSGSWLPVCALRSRASRALLPLRLDVQAHVALDGKPSVLTTGDVPGATASWQAGSAQCWQKPRLASAAPRHWLEA